MSIKLRKQTIKHTIVAKLFDVTPRTIRAWVERGTFPLPLFTQPLQVGETKGEILYFKRSMILHRLETGLWPDGTEFRRTSG